MAELDDKSRELVDDLSSLSSALSNFTKNLQQITKDAASTREFIRLNARLGDAASELERVSREFQAAQGRVKEFIGGMEAFETALDTKNYQQAANAAKRIASTFGNPSIVAAIDDFINNAEDVGLDLGELRAIIDGMHISQQDAITSLKRITSEYDLSQENYRRAREAVDGLANSINSTAIQNNRLATQMSDVSDKLKDFRNSNPAQKQLYYGEALMRAGEALMAFRNSIYEIQSKLGTTFATAFDKTVGAATQVIASYFRTGPALTAQDTIDTINAFQKEFGTLLTTGEAGRIAQIAKSLGTNAEIYFRAQRTFLGAGGIGGQAKIQQQFITQFKSAGLTANQALVFAANNANLVAIAGTRYANELARAAANAQRIGVGLDKTEQLADSLVGDFEGALERFSELRAMGVDVDFNKLAAVAGTGTPEEVVKELSGQLGGNRVLLDQIQRNRFLKVAIERDLGLSIADVKRLAGGTEVLPTEKTVEEKTNELLGGILKWLPVITKSIGALVTVMAANALGLGPIGGVLAVLGGLNILKGLSGMATGGLVTGAGTAMSDNILSKLSPGEYVVNARATDMYGTDMLNRINQGTFVPSQAPVNNVVNVSMDKLEAKLDKLASAMSNMRIDMDGNTVGRVSLNARSPIDRLAVVG